MDQAILINELNDDNKWYEIDHSISQGTIIIEKQGQQQNCELCNTELNDEKFKYSTIERELYICQVCQNTISQFDRNEEFLYSILKQTRFSYEIQIDISDKGKLYNLRMGECGICFNQQILIKLNQCNHYCCDLCLKGMIRESLKTTKQILCPFQCKKEVNDYLIIQYLTEEEIKQWKHLEYYQFCYKNRCKARFLLQPYNNLVQQNIQYDKENNNVYCYSCKTTFCSICWTKHKNNCNFDKLFEKYKRDNNIFKCPCCGQLSEPNLCNVQDGLCQMYMPNWQQCYICYHYFCLDCKGNMELFETIKNNQYLTCLPCKKNNNNLFYIFLRTIKQLSYRAIFALIVYISLVIFIGFLACGFLIVIGIYIALMQLTQVTDWVYQFVKIRVQQLSNGIIIAFSPIIVPLMLIAIILIYIVGFIPLLIYNIRKYFFLDQ